MAKRAHNPTSTESGAQRSGELSTWKEISAFLGVDVRTAQRYEEELHLPVYRLDAGSRGRVYALAEELEAWKGAKSLKPPFWKTVLGLQRVALGLATLATVLAAVLVWALWPVDGPAVQFEAQENHFVAIGPSGVPLWRYRLPKPPQQGDRKRPRVLTDDLDGDGENEILYWFRSEFYLTPDILFCFSQSGEELWRFTPEQELSDRSERFSANYHMRSMRTLRSPVKGDNTRWVAVATVAAWGHPSILALLGSDGTLQRNYVHSGHLEDVLITDLDRDGNEEIVAAGSSASRGTATIVVLDPARLGGASVEPIDSGKQILDLPPAAGELARVYFPRSPVSLQQREGNSVVELYPDGERIVAQVYEMRATTGQWAFLSYVLKPDMSVEKVRADEFMRAAWAEARLADPSFPAVSEDEMERLKREVVVVSEDPRFVGITNLSAAPLS